MDCLVISDILYVDTRWVKMLYDLGQKVELLL